MSKLTPEQCLLAEENINLAHFVAHKLVKKIPGDYEDIFSMCYEGLVLAARRFDASKGFAFSTFAVPYMRFTVLKHTFPRKKVIETISLESLLDNKGNEFWQEITASDNDPFVQLEEDLLPQQMTALINNSNIGELQKQVLILRCQYPNLNQREIAELVGTTQVSVSRATAIANEKLKPVWEAV